MTLSKKLAMINLLQISDIHFHAFPGDDEDAYRNMRNRLLEDMDYIHDNLSTINSLLICGDIAYSGDEKEYQIAKKFITNILERLKKDEKQPNVFMVPGNHDKKRSSYEETRYVLNKALLNDQLETANKFFLKIRNTEQDTIKILYAPLEEYSKFAFEYNSIDGITNAIMTGESTKGKDAFYSRPIGTIGDYTITLIGLNSVLSCDKYDFAENNGHKLFLPKIAINQLKKRNDIFVSVIHHPIEECIKHPNKVRKTFDELYDVQLYGHMHKQSSKVDNSIKIFSGALQPDDQNDTEYFPVYNIISLDIENSNLTVKIHARKWNGRYFVEYLEGSTEYSLSLAPVNTWTLEEKEKAEEVKQEAMNIEETYKIQNDFLRKDGRSRKHIIRKLGFCYQESKNEYANAILFLKWIDQCNKWTELNNLL